MNPRNSSRQTQSLAALLALAAPLLACGPVGSTSVISDAEVAVARAHASDSEKYAVYEVTSADLYLQKAKEEQGHAHYDAASDLARHSEELADAATQKSAAQRGGAAPQMPRATITHQDSVGTPTVGAPKNGAVPTIVPAPAPAAVNPPQPPVLVPAGKP